MEFEISNIKFSQQELNELHDVFANGMGKSRLTNQEILECWERIPLEIKMGAIKWGVGDIPTREEMYAWLKKNHIPFNRKLKDGDVFYLNGDYYGQSLWNSRLMPTLYTSKVPLSFVRECSETGDVLVDPKGPHQTFWMQRSWLKLA